MMIIMIEFRISFVKFYCAQFKTDTQQNNYLISTVLLFSRALKHTYTHPHRGTWCRGRALAATPLWKLNCLRCIQMGYMPTSGNLENISLVLFHPTHYILLWIHAKDPTTDSYTFREAISCTWFLFLSGIDLYRFPAMLCRALISGYWIFTDSDSLSRINMTKKGGVCRTERLLPHNVKGHLFRFFSL